MNFLEALLGGHTKPLIPSVWGRFLCFLTLIVSVVRAGAFPTFVQRHVHTLPKTESTDHLLSPKEIEAFEQDGFILLRGLFSEEELNELTDAGDSLVDISQKDRFNTFSVAERNLIYGSLDVAGNATRNNTESTAKDEAQQKAKIVQTFRNVALRSKLPQICAELMCMDRETQCIRCIRDVFLAKYVSTNPTCDWHVDDQGFWPESFLSSASEESGRDQNGINVWIAMDDYSRVHGGSMVLSRGSHKTPWRHDAYHSIGQNRSQDGGGSMEDVVKKLADPNYYGTCSLDMSNPAVRALAEEGKVEFPQLQRGDCIFATRLLFHRTARVTEEGMEHYSKLGKTLLHRYSIRYVPGTARLPQGNVQEPSVRSNPDNAGKSLDEICAGEDQPCWYPKLWPEVEDKVDEKLDYIGVHEMPTAKERTKVLMQQYAALLKEHQIDVKNFRGRS